MIPGKAFICLLYEAKKIFGEPSKWDTRVVTSWMLTTAKELTRGPKTTAEIVPFTEPKQREWEDA